VRRGGPHLGDAVSVAIGDVRRPETLVGAFEGVDTVVSAVHGFVGPRCTSPASIDRDGNANLVDAACRVGASVVLMSVVGASPDSPMELFRMKYAAEQYAIASGAPTTIVPATAFAELWIELLRQTSERSGRPLVFGRGDNPINFVSVDDVAALVDDVITDTSARGAACEIGGPDNLTFNELAAAVQASAGRTHPPRHIPRPMLRVLASALGPLKPELARQARAALVMDTDDFTFESASVRRLYPDVPCTSVADILAATRESV
jgi:NADH dehydrogenase